jgi:hypothetical protein
LSTVGAVAPGGGSSSSSGSEVKTTNKGKCPYTATMRLLSTTWGVLGVVYILAKAVIRVAPIALEPFQTGSVPLQPWQLAYVHTFFYVACFPSFYLGFISNSSHNDNNNTKTNRLYIVTCLWFAYVEGYKGFQTKFAPLVVKRAFTLVPGQSRLHHFLFAPLYCMGLFYAQQKRLIVSWSVTVGVAAVVAAVKRLPYPYRNIIDAGVVAGLTWGGLSIILLYGKALVTGTLPSIDPALPESSSAAIKKK